MRQCVVALVSVALLAWSAAGGAAGAEQVSRTQLGVLGEPSRFASLTGQQSAILHSFIGWHQPNTLPKLLDRLKPLPMLAIKTGGIVTPLGIAQGEATASCSSSTACWLRSAPASTSGPCRR